MYKAVIMAGGLGTRVRPALAPPINKHLYPVAGKPLLHYPLELLARSGVTDVLILLNGTHPELLLETIEDGTQFGLNVLYAYSRETFGPSVGFHLLKAEHWVQDEPFLLLLGDSVYFIDTIPELDTAQAPHSWCMPLPTAGWDDVCKYAPYPSDPRYIQTGLWLFDKSLFTVARELAAYDEVRIRHLVAALHSFRTVSKTVLPAESFIDCGTPAAIVRAETILRA